MMKNYVCHSWIFFLLCLTFLMSFTIIWLILCLGWSKLFHMWIRAGRGQQHCKFTNESCLIQKKCQNLILSHKSDFIFPQYFLTLEWSMMKQSDNFLSSYWSFLEAGWLSCHVFFLLKRGPGRCKLELTMSCVFESNIFKKNLRNCSFQNKKLPDITLLEFYCG